MPYVHKTVLVGPDTATAIAPASVANVGCGLDVFGFAIDRFSDTVSVRRTDTKGARIFAIESEARLPTAAKKNVCTVVAGAMLRAARAPFGLDVSLVKKLPVGSGLGSSSASAVAAAVATNGVLGNRFSDLDLLAFASEGERAACGSAHRDNVAASLYGGFCIVLGNEVVQVPVPEDWYVAVAHPDVVLLTKKARKALPKSVPLHTMTGMVAGGAALVAAFMQGDVVLFGKAVDAEAVAVRARRGMIPGYRAVERAARNGGALGFSISGAGPSVFAVAPSRAVAAHIATEMACAWRQMGIPASGFVSAIGVAGAL